MNFTDLYLYASAFETPQISVESLRARVQVEHDVIERVDFWGCDLDDDISLGHMLLEMDRTSAYDGEFVVASIRFDRTLNTCWRRFVCCKELMHVFDGALEKTSDRVRFFRLMNELENGALAEAQSLMFKSERNAQWMALIALCPKDLREKHKRDYVAGATEYDIALRLRIPEGCIKALMSDEYDKSLEILLRRDAEAGR